MCFLESLPSSNYVSEKKQGDTILVFEFEEAPDKPVHMLALGQFESSIFINSNSAVLKNYTI